MNDRTNVIYAAGGQRIAGWLLALFGVAFGLSGLAAPPDAKDKWATAVTMAVAGLIFAVSGLSIALKSVRRTTSGIRIRHLFRDTFVPDNDIAALEVRPISSMAGSVKAIVIVRNGDRKPIVLRTLAVYATDRGQKRLDKCMAILAAAGKY